MVAAQNVSFVMMYNDICKDNISIVQYLLQLGVDVNYKDQYLRTALMYACKRAAYNTVVMLLNSAAKINLKDINGMTGDFNVSVCNFVQQFITYLARKMINRKPFSV